MIDNDYESLLKQPVPEIRQQIRATAYRGQTAGFGPGKLQANLEILGVGYADEFLQLCDQIA